MLQHNLIHTCMHIAEMLMLQKHTLHARNHIYISNLYVITSTLLSNHIFSNELWGDLITLTRWWHEIYLLPRGWTRGHPTYTLTDTYCTFSMIYRVHHSKGCKTRSQVKFHRSISPLVSCLYLSCVANPRKLSPPLLSWCTHQGSGSQWAEYSLCNFKNLPTFSQFKLSFTVLSL